ncbi:Myosin-1 [Nymphaea thermarum]|nr:Myosin-1 [Nymphaea thermarum]
MLSGKMIHSSPRKSETALSPKKRNLKARAPNSLQSVKSLPVDLKIPGLHEHPKTGGSEKARGPGRGRRGAASGGEAHPETKVVNRNNDESPYSNKFAVIERDNDGEDSGKPLYLPLNNELSWNDHSVYGAKKVLKVPSESLLPANPEILDGVDDLMQLSYLNEPSVLYNLQCRYSQDLIYTKAGPVLVAVNPFKAVPFYGNDHIEAYRRKKLDRPHVYAIADTAIREMIRDEVNQSLIISGESGAGKTETAKIAMQYLAALGGGSGIEYEILQTNPVLEAFGNAKTLRNDNSSRFSRVVQCAEGERSYHIFYQLCAGASPELREKLNLRSASEYNYLKQSKSFKIDGVDDSDMFRKVKEALGVVHISEEDQYNAFAMVAAVLWLGNISFRVIDNENHVQVVEDEVKLGKSV